MALSIPGLAGLLQTKLQAQQFNGHFFNGTMLAPFCLAVATGVVTISQGITGIIASPSLVGSSSGTGIFFSGSGIASVIKSTAIPLFGQEGPCLQQFCTAVGEAVEEHFQQADLSSDTNGSANFPAFSGNILAMSALIESSAPFTGIHWPNFALAIATGVCQEIGSNGISTLSGAATPGTGAGTVTIT